MPAHDRVEWERVPTGVVEGVADRILAVRVRLHTEHHSRILSSLVGRPAHHDHRAGRASRHRGAHRAEDGGVHRAEPAGAEHDGRGAAGLLLQQSCRRVAVVCPSGDLDVRSATGQARGRVGERVSAAIRRAADATVVRWWTQRASEGGCGSAGAWTWLPLISVWLCPAWRGSGSAIRAEMLTTTGTTIGRTPLCGYRRRAQAET